MDSPRVLPVMTATAVDALERGALIGFRAAPYPAHDGKRQQNMR